MLALSSIAAATAATLDPLDPLDAGDRAWCEGDRRAAALAWQQAQDTDTPAVEAMASVRLLLVSGNLGMLRHGPRADQALAACPSDEPMCALARADYEIVLSWLGLPHDLDRARAHTWQAHTQLPGRAQARSVLLGDASPDSLANYPDRGGLGDGLLAAGGWPPGPGTWFLGLALSGAPGLGVGGAARFVHPDLGRAAWRLDTTASATTRGIGTLSGALVSPGRTFLYTAASARRLVLDDYKDSTVDRIWTLDATAAPGRRLRAQAIWAGPMLRLDDGAPAHGAQAGWSARTQTLTAAVRAEASLAGVDHQRIDSAITARWPLGRGQLAARLAAEEALGSDAPWWRRPTAGGGVHLRSAPANRWQADWLIATAAEWRQPIVGPLGAVIFAEGAWLNTLHPGIGAGLRLSLPPQPLNTVRLDLAWGEEGLVLTAGWGEAF